MRRRRKLWESELFDEAEDWYGRMKRCSEGNGTLEQLLEIAGEYLPYYIAVMDPDFLILGRYLSDAEASEDIHSETGYLKMELVNALRQDACYDAVEQYQQAFLYTCRGLKYRFLCVNLMERGSCRGRINVRENPARPFQSWEGFFLEQVRDVLLPVFLRNSRLQKHSRRHREFVQLLLEGKEHYQDELYWFLEDIGWKEQGLYCCACLQMEVVDMERESPLYYARELEYLLRDTVCVTAEYRIYLLHAVGQEPCQQQEFWKRINYFIRESNFRMGVSREYSDIRKTPFARSQSQIALDYGKDYFPQQWKHEFGS